MSLSSFREPSLTSFTWRNAIPGAPTAHLLFHVSLAAPRAGVDFSGQSPPHPSYLPLVRPELLHGCCCLREPCLPAWLRLDSFGSGSSLDPLVKRWEKSPASVLMASRACRETAACAGQLAPYPSSGAPSGMPFLGRHRASDLKSWGAGRVFHRTHGGRG